MAAIDDLNTKIQKLQQDVQQLLQQHQAGASD
jgi:outer membrane murein-binding lipoprotein Lpp